MELIAVRAAAVLVYVPLERVNPFRRAKDRELTQRLVERYAFLKYPQTYEEHNDHENGARFADGIFEGIEVKELKIFSNGFFIDTGESTEIADRFFDDMASVWREAGLKLTSEMVTSKGYISQLAVKSDVDLIAPNAALMGVIDNWFPNSSGDPNRSAAVTAIGIQLSGNPDLAPPVRIERLAGSPLEVLEFYSQAPMPTVLHVSFLTRWETVQRESNPSSPTEPEPQP